MAKFIVLDDGCIQAVYKKQDYEHPAKFYLNDYNGVNTKNGINLISGKKYRISDCIMYYKIKQADGSERDASI
jgi:hypothetical protein